MAPKGSPDESHRRSGVVRIDPQADGLIAIIGLGGLDHDRHLVPSGFEGFSEASRDAEEDRPSGRALGPVAEPEWIRTGSGSRRNAGSVLGVRTVDRVAIIGLASVHR